MSTTRQQHPLQPSSSASATASTNMPPPPDPHGLSLCEVELAKQNNENKLLSIILLKQQQQQQDGLLDKNNDDDTDIADDDDSSSSNNNNRKSKAAVTTKAKVEEDPPGSNGFWLIAMETIDSLSRRKNNKHSSSGDDDDDEVNLNYTTTEESNYYKENLQSFIVSKELNNDVSMIMFACQACPYWIDFILQDISEELRCCCSSDFLYKICNLKLQNFKRQFQNLIENDKHDEADQLLYIPTFHYYASETLRITTNDDDHRFDNNESQFTGHENFILHEMKVMFQDFLCWEYYNAFSQPPLLRHHLSFVPQTLCDNESFIERLLDYTGGYVLIIASDRLRNDAKFILQLMERNPQKIRSILDYTPQELQRDRDFLLAGIKSRHLKTDMMWLVPRELLSNRTFMLRAIEEYDYGRYPFYGPLHYASMSHIESYRDDYELIKLGASKGAVTLRFATNRLREMKDIVLLAVQNDNKERESILECVPYLLRNDFDIAKAAVQNTGFGLRYLQKYQNDRQIVSMAIEQDGLAIKFASDELQDDEKLAMIAVGNCGLALKFVSPTQKANRNVVKKAISNNHDAFKYSELQNDIEIFATKEMYKHNINHPQQLKDHKGLVNALEKAANACDTPEYIYYILSNYNSLVTNHQRRGINLDNAS